MNTTSAETETNMSTSHHHQWLGCEIAGPNGMDHVQEFFRIFRSQVDMKGIIETATRVRESAGPVVASSMTPVSSSQGTWSLLLKPQPLMLAQHRWPEVKNRLEERGVLN
jgi:hypothetical protein